MSYDTLFAGTQNDDNSVGTVAWSLGGGDVFADDGSYISVSLAAGEQSHYLFAKTFGFAIPSTATILGVSVQINRYADDTASPGTTFQDTLLKLLKAGVPVGFGRQDTGTQWPAVEAAVSYGASNDLWDTTLTYSDVNNADFGVALSIDANGGMGTAVAYVDYVTITVYYSDAADPPSTSLVVGFVSAVRRVSLQARRGRSTIVGPLTDEPPTASDMAFVEIVSAQRRFAGARSRFVNATPGTSAIFTEPAFTESVWLEQIVAPIRPRGMHALRPLAYLVQVDLPAGNGECECNPGGAVLVGFAYVAVLVSVTDYSLGVGQYGATLVSQGFGRAVVVSVCEC